MPLFLSNEDQAASITPREALDAFTYGLEQMARGDAMRRPRTNSIIPTSTPGLWFEFSSMEGGQRDGYYALRIKPNLTSTPTVSGNQRLVSYNMKPGNWGGLVFLFDSRTAEFVAIMNDGYIQHLRVAASAALGIKWLARSDARVMGVYGSGGMARFIPLLAQEVRSFDRLQVYSPNTGNLEAYCAEMQTKLDMEIVSCSNPRDVCRDADVVLGCTNSTEPVMSAEWLEPGVHLNNVVPWEFDDDTYARVDTAGVFLDRSPMSIAGLVDDDFSFRIQVMSWLAGSPEEREQIMRGSQDSNRCPNARTVLCYDWATETPFERSETEITYLDTYSNGVPEGDAGGSAGLQGLQFSAAGGRIYENARAKGVGSELPLDMFLQDMAT